MEQIPSLPLGFTVAGVHCGLKRNPEREDFALVVTDRPAVGVGVYTQNLVAAAPVQIDRQRTPSTTVRAVAINSGNANACTGDRGIQNALQMAGMTAELCGIDEEQVLVLSTGIIGEHLPMDKIERGIQSAFKKLGREEGHFVAAARGFMTTDSVHKIRGREVEIAEQAIRVTGIAKGAAMIGPNMATMLSVVMTDAAVHPDDAQAALVDAVEESFHCISVDGHTSTNDTVLLLANGASQAVEGDGTSSNYLSGKALEEFRATLLEVCEDLAQSIPADGEGATHLITVEVHGCRDRKEALVIGKTIADSPLVKTAVAGADPNWGRIVSAAGYAGIPFDPHKVSLHINDILLYENGAPVPFDPEATSKSISSQRETHITLILEEGTASARFWTTDLTAEYVRLNADYHT